MKDGHFQDHGVKSLSDTGSSLGKGKHVGGSGKLLPTSIGGNKDGNLHDGATFGNSNSSAGMGNHVKPGSGHKK